MPYFASSRWPVIVNNSLLLDNDVVIGVVRSLVTPKDVCVLGTRDDNRVVSDDVTLSVQSATSVTSVRHRLIVKSHEVQVERVIFGSSSDGPQKVVRENPKEEVQKAKLKSPVVEIENVS
ncbi:unnamed protein product [Prunus armeniaca]